MCARDQRQQGDAQQQPGEGQAPGQRERRRIDPPGRQGRPRRQHATASRTGAGPDHRKNSQVTTSKRRQHQHHAPAHEADEAGHPHPALRGDGPHHEVRRIADIGQRPHEDRPAGDRQQRPRQLPGQQLRVAAGELEEHDIGRRIVEEGGQPAGRPEIGRRPGLPVRPLDQVDQPAEGPRLPLVQHRHDRGHADEDGGEQLRHLLEGRPGEQVGGPVAGRRQAQRQQPDADHRQHADQPRQRDPLPQQVDVGRLHHAAGCGDADHRGQQRDIRQAP